MQQPDHTEATEQAAGHVEAAEHAGDHAAEGFNAGEVIIEHVANSSFEHPILHLPPLLGIDFSVTKHVFMLLLVATAVFLLVTTAVPLVQPGKARGR